MNTLEELLQYKNGLNILWTGNDGWLLWDGKRLIGFDLDLCSNIRKEKSNMNIELLREKLDVLFITHAHDDHFNLATIAKLLPIDCHFIIPQSCEEKVAQTQIEQQNITFVKPNQQLTIAEIPIRCMRALHGHKEGTIYRNASLLDCGYIIEFAGKRIYQPGDTVILEEHLSLDKIDVLFISPTEHNTKIKNSTWLINKLHPQKIIAQHFGTYIETPENSFWSHGYVDELYENLNIEQQERFVKPNQKTIITI